MDLVYHLKKLYCHWYCHLFFFIFLHPNKINKKKKYKRRGIKLKSLQNVCNFCTDALSVVSGDKMITLVSLNIVGTICLSPNLPKPICIHVLLPSCYAVSI